MRKNRRWPVLDEKGRRPLGYASSFPVPLALRAQVQGTPFPFLIGRVHKSYMADLIASSEDVRIYECAVLYPYGLSQKDEATLVKEIEGYFDEVGAKLISKDAWGRRGLAYPIKGSGEANVTIYYFEIDPLKVKEVDQNLKISKAVLRHMFVKPPKHYQIVKYGDKYEQWLKERESLDQKKTRERQTALEEKVAAKAKRRAKTVTEKKVETKPKEALTGEAMTQQIDKLISDDNLL